MKIQIKNGRLIDPRADVNTRTDLYIGAGRIVGIGQVPAGFVANRVVDANGLIVCPGLIDLSARLREPGLEYRATLDSEIEAAAAGGITSLVCPPDTDPPLDEPGLVEMLKYRAMNLNRTRVFPLGALTVKLAGERLTEMGELSEAGCVGFTQANTPIVDTRVLLRALQYAATFGYRVWLQPSDPFLGHDGVAHDGEVATRLGLPGIPACAETVALGTLLQLAQLTGAKLHITRLSSAASVAMVRAAKTKGLSLTCDVSINHLHLTEMDIGYFNAHAHLQPPLRAASDREALRRGLAEGVIDAVCSDHTPVDDDAKQVPFAEAEPGATGLELLLPLTLKWAQETNLPLTKALGRLTSDAARILDMDVGHLGVGAAADLCVFDPQARFRVARDDLRSQGKNTPFLGLELDGRVRYTLVDGRFVYEAGAGH